MVTPPGGYRDMKLETSTQVPQMLIPLMNSLTSGIEDDRA